MWTDLILIALLILINGFFAAAEIAVVTARKVRIKQLSDEGRPNAQIFKRLREEPDRFLATIQIGVTLASATASAIGGIAAAEVIKPVLKSIPIPFIASSSEPIAIGIVVIFITYFSLIFGELIPKSIALANPEGVGLFAAPVIDVFSKISNIFVKLLTATTNLLLRPFGKKAFSERGYITEEEIKMLIEEGRERGIFESDEKELIHSVFEFTDTSVKEIMLSSPQITSIGISMSIEKIKSIIDEEKFSRYPVIGKDSNDIRGILYARDFYTMLSRLGAFSLHKIIRPPFFVPETMKISNLLREMQRKRIHMAIVIDEYGSVSGLVTLEDVLEEIVGEIRDEYDVESPVIQLKDGSMIIDASISIDDLKEDYEIDIPSSSEYDTLSGFILTYLQRIPKTGDTIELMDKTLRIIEMVGQRIAKVKLEKTSAEGELLDA
ncbi:MAG: hemolysin family protein [Nitrospirae bacterium]|nr:hemolysin family protein [Nitrospirota bacterium]